MRNCWLAGRSVCLQGIYKVTMEWFFFCRNSQKWNNELERIENNLDRHIDQVWLVSQWVSSLQCHKIHTDLCRVIQSHAMSYIAIQSHTEPQNPSRLLQSHQESQRVIENHTE